MSHSVLEGSWEGTRTLPNGAVTPANVEFKGTSVVIDCEASGRHQGDFKLVPDVDSEDFKGIHVEFEEEGESCGIFRQEGSDSLTWATAAPGRPYPETLNPGRKIQFFELRRSATCSAYLVEKSALEPTGLDLQQERRAGLDSEAARLAALGYGADEPQERTSTERQRSRPAEEVGKRLKVGFLRKRGHVVKNWKTRYVVLTRKMLLYYETPEDYSEKRLPRGYVSLQQAVAEAGAPKGVAADAASKYFIIRETFDGGETYYFEATDANEAAEWVDACVGAVLSAWKGRSTKPPAMKVASDGSRKRCMNCEQLYIDADTVNDFPCTYHPGTFRRPGGASEAVFSGWSCCRTVDADAPGCKRDENGRVVHKVAKGDTLQGVALRYGVSVSALKSANKIAGSQIWANELVIPVDKGEIMESAQASHGL